MTQPSRSYFRSIKEENNAPKLIIFCVVLLFLSECQNLGKCLSNRAKTEQPAIK